VLTFVAKEGGKDPAITMTAILFCLKQPKEDVKCHRKLKGTEALRDKVKDYYAQQLEYLPAWARSLEEALNQQTAMRVLKAHKRIKVQPGELQS
jgi:hypothetical protein